MKILKKTTIVNRYNQCLTFTYFVENNRKGIAINDVCQETSSQKWSELETFKNARNIRKYFLKNKVGNNWNCGLMTKFGKETTPYLFHKINQNWGSKIDKWLLENYIKFGGNFPISEKMTDCERNLINIHLFGRV